VRNRRKRFRLPILKELKHPPNVVLESLRKCMDILIRKEGKEVRRLGRIAPHKFDRVSPLEDARDLIARHQNRELPLRAFHPLRELPLRMRIGSIDFI
jgi:hypothetical protein